MARLGKWIGGGLGWVMGGPIGALLGFLLGSVVDSASDYIRPEIAETSRKTTPGGFGVTFIVLIAAVMKADGKVLKSELDYVKQYFVRQFGRETAREA
ncbi:MAG TPA: molecular chaperone DnaJ, partial [Bacteroidales bacterium]|nr:molecular chaperone DnaJ [Bacteroidales bacterium]